MLLSIFIAPNCINDLKKSIRIDKMRLGKRNRCIEINMAGV